MSASENESAAPAPAPEDTKALRQSCAEALAAAGFPLIPLNGKKPIPLNWTETKPGTYTPEDLAAVGNYGVVLSASDLVVDVDPRHFKEGDAPVKRLISDIGSPLNSFVVKTGGGGLHIYLTKPADFKVVGALKDYPGIEFKTKGQQVVGPGSIHPDTGAPYTIASGTVNERAAAPQALLDLIRKKDQSELEKGNGKGTEKYHDDKATISRAAAYLLTAPVAVAGENGDATTFKVAAALRDFGLSPQAALDLLDTAGGWNSRCNPPWDGEELKTKVFNAYKYATGPVGAKHPAADFEALDPLLCAAPASTTAKTKPGAPLGMADMPWITNKDGSTKKCFQNLLNYLNMGAPNAHIPGLAGVFGYNEFTGAVEFQKPAPWHRGRLPRQLSVTDADLKLLKTFLVEKHGFEVNIGNIEEAVTAVGHKHQFHPVKEYLEGLKWDGKERLSLWLRDYAHVKDTAYTRACARKTLCAAVARVFRPGIQFDHVLVLEGKQKLGKTSICRILGGEWYGDPTIDPHSKDTVQALQGKWIIEMAEMEVTNRSELRSLKAFVTRLVDKARLAYGRLSSEFPRQCIFIGTINPGPDGNYLKDNTGNRRWWPVEVKARVDFKGLKAVRDQLWAEAVAAVKNGETIYMDTPELETAAETEANQRHAEHPWQERIASWLEVPVVTGVDPETKQNIEAPRMFVTTRDIFIDAMGGVDKQLDRKAALDIAEVMRQLGWERTQRRDASGAPRKGYARTAESRMGAVGGNDLENGGTN